MKRKISSEKTRLFLYFFFIALLGSILLSLPQAYKNGIPVNYIDALFTSVSAICVTGLSTLSMDVFSRTGLIFILILIEAGGLGILTYISFLMTVSSKKISVVNGNLIKDFYIDDIDFNPKSILKKINFDYVFLSYEMKCYHTGETYGKREEYCERVTILYLLNVGDAQYNLSFLLYLEHGTEKNKGKMSAFELISANDIYNKLKEKSGVFYPGWRD